MKEDAMKPAQSNDEQGIPFPGTRKASSSFSENQPERASVERSAPVVPAALLNRITPPRVKPSRKFKARSHHSEESVPALWKAGDVILDRYEVIGKLGEGGMGTVYKVHHRRWNIDLAVKSPKPEIFTREGGKENFIREAETWVKLDPYPCIVNCFYVDSLGGIPRIFAEYVDGGSLADRIRSRKLYEGGHRLALERMLDVAIQCAWGLHFAHEQGLVHQDVKPANVMMTRKGIAKVTDFGLAKARQMAGEADAQKAEQSALVSFGGMTPAYCSPEQAAHRTLSRKTDIWSWGVSVLEMFVGEVTWMSGAFARKVLASHEPQDPAIPPMPAEMVKLLNRCFQNRPEDRPTTMLEIASDLQALYERLVGRSYPYQMPRPVERELDTGLLLTQARSLIELGRLEEALVICERTIRLDPAHADAYSVKGNVLEQLGRLEEALVSYEQTIRLDPIDTRAYVDKGSVLEKLGRLEEALTSLEHAIHLDPMYAVAHLNKGYMLQQLGRREEALVSFEQGLLLDPTDTRAYVNKGLALRQLGRLEEALTSLEHAIHLDPTMAEAYLNKGLVLLDLGKREEALVAFERIIQLDPTDVDAYHDKGIALKLLGRLEEALASFEQANHLDPIYAAAYANKGAVLALLGRPEEALTAFEQAIRLDPMYTVAYVTKGQALGQLRRREEALAAFEQGIRFDPTFVEAYYNKGAVLYELGRLEEALASYEQVIRLDPTAVLAYSVKGAVLGQLGRLEEALASCEQAIRLDPTLVHAHYNKGATLGLLGRRKEALASFEQAIRLDPTDAKAYYGKSTALYELGRLEEALASLGQALQLDSTHVRT